MYWKYVLMGRYKGEKHWVGIYLFFMFGLSLEDINYVLLFWQLSYAWIRPRNVCTILIIFFNLVDKKNNYAVFTRSFIFVN